MGIKDFLKNLFKQEEIKPLKIELSNLTNFIQNKEQENQTKNQDFLNSINQSIQDLIEDLKPQIKVLENIDLSEKKTEEKVKLIVKQNLDNYINHVKKLIIDFKTLTEKKEHNPESMINRINEIFDNFEKNSSMSYQKATFIIGREIENITNTLTDFSKNFQTIVKENKYLISTCQTFNLVKERLNEFEKHQKINQEIINKIDKTNKELKELKNKRESLNKDIEKIKDSKEYKNELQQNQSLEDKKMQLEKSTLSLKQLIDFKSLANYCHSNEREMNIIKKHKDNFLEAFQKDSQTILTLLNEAKLSKPEIEEKVKKISKIQGQIKELNQNLILKYSVEISLKEFEINKIKREIENLLNQLNKEKKRLEKIRVILNNIKEEIKQKVGKIGIEIMSSNI